jgi:hypothetical protein
VPSGQPFDEALEELDSRWQRLRWRITGPFLVLLGITQAIFGWAGDSLWMRLGYAVACVAVGVLLIVNVKWFCPPAVEEEPEFAEEPAAASDPPTLND